MSTMDKNIKNRLVTVRDAIRHLVYDRDLLPPYGPGLRSRYNDVIDPLRILESKLEHPDAETEQTARIIKIDASKWADQLNVEPISDIASAAATVQHGPFVIKIARAHWTKLFRHLETSEVLRIAHTENPYIWIVNWIIGLIAAEELIIIPGDESYIEVDHRDRARGGRRDSSAQLDREQK